MKKERLCVESAQEPFVGLIQALLILGLVT